MTVLQVGVTRVERRSMEHTVTTLHDGAVVHAVPHDDDAYRAHASALGYGGDTAAMSYEHELLHTMLADWLGLDESPVMRAVADATWMNGSLLLDDEEAAVLAIQRFCRSAGVTLGRIQAGGPRVRPADATPASGAGVEGSHALTRPRGPWAAPNDTGGEVSICV